MIFGRRLAETAVASRQEHTFVRIGGWSEGSRRFDSGAGKLSETVTMGSAGVDGGPPHHGRSPMIRRPVAAAVLVFAGVSALIAPVGVAGATSGTIALTIPGALAYSLIGHACTPCRRS